MLRWKRVEISGGFLLLTAFLYYMDADNILPWAFAACGLHELGHYLMITLLGGRVSLLRLSCVGAEMRLSGRYPLTRLGRMLSALAGPAVNLFLAVVFARMVGTAEEWSYLFAGLNLTLGVFNLLPVAQLDGGRVLFDLLAIGWGECLAKQIVHVSSLTLGAALSLGGLLVLVRTGGNPTLLITAIWLLLSVKEDLRRDKGGHLTV